MASGRFIPTLFNWYLHPKCIRLREADPGNEGRWNVVINVAHESNDRGRLTAEDGEPYDAYSLASRHDRRLKRWTSFIELCKSIDLLKEVDGVLEVVPWSSWYRSPSQMPEAQSARQAEYRAKQKAEKLTESLEEAQSQIEVLKKRLDKKAESRYQLELDLESSDTRPDRAAEDNRRSGTRSARNQDSDACPDHGAEVNRPRKAEIRPRDGPVTTCHEVSQAVTDGHDSRSTWTCISRDPTCHDLPPKLAQETGSKPPVVARVDSFEDNVVSINAESGEANFWAYAERLFRKHTKRRRSWEEYGKPKLQTALSEGSFTYDYPDPGAWYYALSFSIQECKCILADDPHKRIGCVWAYSMGFFHKFVPYAAESAEGKRKYGRPIVFRRLRDLQVAI